MILAVLALVGVNSFVGGVRMRVPWELTATIWVAMAGCLLHGKFDFPFQIYSILFLFLLLAGILLCSSNRRLGA
jgi:hypothetical protein